MTDRQFTHPNFGNQARVEIWGKEVRLIFVASDRHKAEEMATYLVDQLSSGALNITVMGKPKVPPDQLALLQPTIDKCFKERPPLVDTTPPTALGQ